MAAVAPSPFVIPSADEVAAFLSKLDRVVEPIDRLSLNLYHATGQVREPLKRFAEQPTHADIGVLCVFADDLVARATEIAGIAEQIGSLLIAVDSARVDWDIEGGGDDA